jgi:type I restriction enzyme S subunit
MKNGQQNFLYFLLKKSEKAFLSNTTGTVFDSISGGQLREFEVLIPEREEEQCAIAAVLSSLDDKIELLREQNKTLEATAQAIFKEWFVNFNFPGATGKMIDSELGEIPEGWRVGKIKDLIDILSGFAFSSSDFSQDGNYKLVTIKNVQDRHFDPETKDRLSALPVRMPEYCKLNSGDILLSLTGNVGRICLVNGDNFLLNQRVAKLKEKNPSDYAFTYLLFLQDSIFSLLQSTASGTAQQNLSPIQTKEIEIIIADRKTLDQFGMVANKLIQKINDNNSQVETLSKLRDTLLPKLMTGNVRVKGFED